MQTKRPPLPEGRYLPLMVFFLACCFLIVLLSTIRPNVFFSGDAGLKYQVVKQLVRSGHYQNLKLDQPAWVQEIWSQGFYPFKPPFVYDRDHSKLVSFPPAFQWLSAAFYKWFGFYGLYVLPVLSLVLCWVWFMFVVRKVTGSKLLTACGLFLLAFCSPLSIYAATYWEHTLALLLVFSGMVFLVIQPVSRSQALLLGLLSGLAAWLRPETIVLSGLISVAAVYNYCRKKNIVQLFFITGFLLMLIAFFAFNQLTYGSMLGAHGLQVTGENKEFSGLIGSLTILAHINARLILFFPTSVLFYILAVYLFVRRPAMPAIIYQLVLITILYALITPFILPNAGGKQWGPRYFLPVVPLMLITLCLVFKGLALAKNWLILVVPILAYSLYLNVYDATRILKNDYAYRVSPALKGLNDDSARKVVVVQNQFIAQEFAAAFDSKIFFRAESNQQFTLLIRKLAQSGVSSFIYITINPAINLPVYFTNHPEELKQLGGYYVGVYPLNL